MAGNFALSTCKTGYAIALVFFAVLLDSAWAEDQKLSIATEEWPPYNYIDNGSPKGFSVDIVRKIASDLNTSIEIKFFPSMRAKVMLEKGPRTMLITMLRTAEREKKYKWIGPLGDSSIYFYKSKGNPLVISTIEDAKKVDSICSRQSGLVFSRLKAAGFTNLDAGATEGKAVYRMLIHGRCDLAVSDSPAGVARLLKILNYPPDAIVQTPVKLASLPAYIACSKDIPDAEVARWQQALDGLKASGAFDTMLRKYDE